jgi:hypothetical protein
LTAVPVRDDLPSAVAVLQAGHLDELEAKRQNAVECAKKARLIQVPDQGGVAAYGFGLEIPELCTSSLAQNTSDGDPIAVDTHVAPRMRQGFIELRMHRTGGHPCNVHTYLSVTPAADARRIRAWNIDVRGHHGPSGTI